MNMYTKRDLVRMWQRPVETQYQIAQAKILQAIAETEGDICISFSGGKDSSLLLDMYAELLQLTPYAVCPINVAYADTTNETDAMKRHIDRFIQYIQQRYNATVNLKTVRPKIAWAKFVLENGIPLISKQQSKCISAIKKDVIRLGVPKEELLSMYALGSDDAVNKLKSIGFSDTSVLALTGWVSIRKTFGHYFTVSKKWLPMVYADVDLSHRCCSVIKEAPLIGIKANAIMTGEQAGESANREAKYLQTGCNSVSQKGIYTSKPLGPMTNDGILYALSKRNTPICEDYGHIVKTPDGHYTCTKAQRTGCALCGFGCQYDTERFVRLQETEPAKVKFAFKPKSEGGAGYKEVIEYMNEYCGTNVKIPKV